MRSPVSEPLAFAVEQRLGHGDGGRPQALVLVVLHPQWDGDERAAGVTRITSPPSASVSTIHVSREWPGKDLDSRVTRSGPRRLDR